MGTRKNPAAVALGRKGGSANTATQQKARRKAMAVARQTRWKKNHLTSGSDTCNLLKS